MRLKSSTRAPRASLICLALCGALGACNGNEADPTGVVLTAETQSSVRLGLERSALPSLAGLSGSAPAVTEASELWEGSWTLTIAEARAARERAYDLAVPELAAGLEPEELDAAANEVGLALAILEGLDAEAFAPSVVRRVEHAIEAYGRSRVALEEGATEFAVRSLLVASDAVREVTPRRLASLLRVTAEVALGRISDDDAYPEETLRRIERLVRGADSAIRTQEYPTAIRRAYYACLLLGVELP